MSETSPFDSLDASLRALPLLQPPRSAWPGLAAQLQRSRRQRRMFALAAGLAAVALLLPQWLPRSTQPPPASVDQTDDLQPLLRRSAQLEHLLAELGGDRPVRVSDLLLRDELGERLQRVDALLAAADTDPDAQWLLWRQRVALLQELLAVATDAPSLVTLSDAAGSDNPILL